MSRYLHLSKRPNGDLAQPLDETVIFILTTGPDGITLTTQAQDGKELYILLHDQITRPKPARDQTWLSEVKLKASALGSAWAEVVSILRGHNLTMVAARDLSPTPGVKRYNLAST
ncbi:MAG: hypothetical protein P8J32_01690 [bacterium]|nr:hypothetical protein [bacterium]